MENIEEKLGSILNNPQMMQQIIAMAQSLGNNSAQKQEPESEKTQTKNEQPSIDLSMVSKLSGLAGNSGIDQNQKQLLQALSPYLSKERVSKLENAMRAAKMAKLASSFLGNGSLQPLNRR